MDFQKNILREINFQIKNHPDNIAFCINETFYTYFELGDCISRVREIIRINHPSEKLFGLVVNDSLETYATILSLWLEGKGFVSIHPKNPIERNLEIIKQTEIKSFIDSTKYSIIKGLYKIDLDQNLEKQKTLKTNKYISDQEIAYILFTSGSTGKPKGVIIDRKNLHQFFIGFWDSGVKINSKDRCLQCFDLTFDVSIQTFIAPLIKGACVYTVPQNKIKFSYVYYLLNQHKLSFAVMPPSMLRYLKPYFEEINLSELKTCILTAEASPEDLVKSWFKCIPNAEVFNFYGPTEATIYCTFYKVPRTNIKTQNGMLCIGKPMKDVKAIVLDSNDKEVDHFEKGELCISTDQLTSGYWKNKKLNEKVFFNKGFSRFYRTGDICYVDNSYNFFLFGRKDHQIKIDGYRIELGEIEFNAKEIINEEVVVIVNKKNDNSELTLFVETKQDISKKIKSNLSEKLPNYMLPNKVICLESFPLNTNNKIDRVKLKSQFID